MGKPEIMKYRIAGKLLMPFTSPKGHVVHLESLTVLCLQYVTEADSIHGISRDSHWQQSGATHILINAFHWPQRPCSAP